MRIKVSAGNQTMQRLLTRQTPGRMLRWGEKTFFFGDQYDHCDWWFVLHAGGLEQAETVQCDPAHTVFITMEPPVWGRPVRFCQQFATIVTADSGLNHPSIIARNGITWWAGIDVAFENGHVFSPAINQDFDSFFAMPVPVKEDRISVITSLNQSFPGHGKRLRFLERLRRHPVSQSIDFYGGTNPVKDKLDGLLRYKYHIAIENSVVPDYWTEKIADPFLAHTLPIYAGCPNIEDYFPADSVLRLDLDDFDAAVDLIMACLRHDEYSRRLLAIREARSRVLLDYNVFELMASICDRPAQRFELCTLRPMAEVQPSKPAVVRCLASMIRRLPLFRP